MFIGKTQFYTWLRFAGIKDPKGAGAYKRNETYTDYDRALLLRLAELFKEERLLDPRDSTAPLRRASQRLLSEIENERFAHYDQR